MSTISNRMLEALRCFLSGKKVLWKDGIKAEEWVGLFRLAQRHQILPMIYEAVYGCPAFSSCPAETAKTVRGRVIRQVMAQSMKTSEFLEAYAALTEKGLAPLVVKGLVCRELYPKPDHRCSGDEDVLIRNEQFRECADVFREKGMEMLIPDMDPDTEGEVPYYKVGGLLHIELHRELFPSESEAYGSLNRMFENAHERKRRMTVNGITVYTMSHTDHLLYLILHAFKHFLHSGFGVRQVCDIIRYAEAYGADTDWEYIMKQCRTVHADVFAASLFNIGRQELLFDEKKACYPKEWKSAEADGSDMLEDLIDGGVFGGSSLSRQHSSNITLQAVSESRKGGKGQKGLLSSLFPGRRYMERTYGWLKKYPFLLPAAWTARIVKYIKEAGGTDGGVKESLEIGNRRVDLMKKYKII